MGQCLYMTEAVDGGLHQVPSEAWMRVPELPGELPKWLFNGHLLVACGERSLYDREQLRQRLHQLVDQLCDVSTEVFPPYRKY